MKDLTKIKTAFGLLGKKTRKALVAHFEAGGEVELWAIDGWVRVRQLSWSDEWIYRKKPIEPVTPVLSPEYRDMFEAVLARPDAHPIFAAVKEWQEAQDDTDYSRQGAADRVLRNIKVPE